MEGRHIGIIVVALLVLVGGWYMLSVTPAEAPASQDTAATSTPLVTVTEGAAVVYTDQGFIPPSITIPAGTKVTFVNQSTKDMWVASAMHPSHSVYSGTTLSEHCPDADGTAFDACENTAPGATYTFTFSKAGTWKYHDHLDASKFGTIVVTKE